MTNATPSAQTIPSVPTRRGVDCGCWGCSTGARVGRTDGLGANVPRARPAPVTPASYSFRLWISVGVRLAALYLGLKGQAGVGRGVRTP